jgi:haloacetate dehalogenase
VLLGFRSERLPANGVSINVTWGGDGPAVLLLHGYPQTHAMWNRVASDLAEQFTVVCPDLRGYGDSEKPPGGGDHSAYSKREMARDQVEVMGQLGFEQFAVAGHDRGARVALRMVLDHPGKATRLAVLDIVPTRTIYATLNKARATTVWRYLFLVQPYDLPERLIDADPDFYLRWTLEEWAGTPDAISDEARSEYGRCFDRATIHASCEDYRAGASIDLVHDEADASVPLSCPLLAVWSSRGIGASYDVEAIWRERAADFRGVPLDCGHFLAEERPRETAQLLLDFFR